MVSAKSYWNSRYAKGGDSGYGSRGVQLARKLAWLSTIEPPQNITEVGCGDFFFGSNLLLLFPNAEYLGQDISEVAVMRNAERYPTRRRFEVRSPGDPVPPADLLLCIDVLYHVPDDAEAEALLIGLEEGWTKYLALTAYEYAGIRNEHVFIRPFNPQRFGKPIVRQIVEEDGDLYFYLYKR